MIWLDKTLESVTRPARLGLWFRGHCQRIAGRRDGGSPTKHGAIWITAPRAGPHQPACAVQSRMANTSCAIASMAARAGAGRNAILSTAWAMRAPSNSPVPAAGDHRFPGDQRAPWAERTRRCGRGIDRHAGGGGRPARQLIEDVKATVQRNRGLSPKISRVARSTDRRY